MFNIQEHNSIYLWGFSRILPTAQQCIQDISKNLREAQCKKSSVWLIFW